MAAPSTPSAASSLSWEKAIQVTKPTRIGNRKKGNPLLIIAVIAMVILAISGIWRSTHQVAQVKMMKVVSPRRDTGAGVRLAFMSLSYLDIPKEFVTADMVTSLNDADNHLTRVFVPAGEPLRKTMLFQTGQVLSQTLDSNERAITLKLDDDELVDHTIAPDDLVDVVVVSSKDNQKYAKTICQGARVIMAVSRDQAVARNLGSNNNKITLAVSPTMAESISEASEVGKIRLVLRNRLCLQKSPLSGSEPKDLLPALAYKNDKEVSKQSTLAFTPLPPKDLTPPPLFSLPPQPSSSATDEIGGPNPLQWMVQVFSGSKKETVGVPTE